MEPCRLNYVWSCVLIIASSCLVTGCLARQPIKVTEQVTGPYTFSYCEVKGDYNKTASTFKEIWDALVRNGISPKRSLGIYLDDPKKTPANACRSFCGVIIEETDWNKLEGLRGLFKIEHIYKAKRLVVEELHAGYEPSEGNAQCYAALQQYARSNGFSSLGFFEIYESGKTSYIMSVKELAYAVTPHSDANDVQSGNTPDVWPDPDWQVSTPEAQGMSSAQIMQMLDKLPSYFDLDVLNGLLIIRHGKIVTEVYVAPDEPDYRHELHSVTKSVVAALVGVALQKGYIHSLEDHMLSYFPGEMFQNTNQEKSSITIADLLNMTSGLEYLESPRDDSRTTRNRMFASPDWARFTLNLC